MAQVPVQTIHRDPQLFYWILFPITIVMILTGILRHYATVLMSSPPKPLDLRSTREQRSLLHGISLRSHFHALPTPANPMTDPSSMDGMMGMMKNQMAMIIPNTLIMSWINAFFSGYVIMKLPFPLTIKFKSMLQAGVGTKDMDPRWMSSISWYFLCMFGLQSVFNFLLGNDNAASQMAQQMGQMGPQASQMFGPGVDPNKQFMAEAENLAVIEHHSVLDGVEQRLLEGIRV
ncbi:integral membrane protein DUF106-domain-containing protein [Apiosordaria backusii]|uniref:ER membrane protein complex subunit 3 n=1 Tax=Apiosordaria backusii TaxID=314023 RepID=A0AA40DZ04_9PEZI|nr:integral membrane protein DUF106-domain-containing protein [Apiosordaria backusii]